MRCKFGVTYAKRVHDQFIHGTSNPRVREKLLARGKELSLEKVKEIGRTLEALFMANQAFVSAQPKCFQVIGHGAQEGGAKNKNGNNGRSNWGRREVTGTYPEGRDVTKVPKGSNDNFPPQSSSESRTAVQNEKSRGDLPRQACGHCGSRRHRLSFRNYTAKNRRCRKCNTLGHFGKMCCKTDQVQNVSAREVVGVIPERQANKQASSSAVVSSYLPAMDVLTVGIVSRRDLVVHPVVGGVNLQLLVNTGVSVS